ncbi:MAG: NUDIX domain-containing protein [Nanoarchaeota archaeon]|nr:NUDIX domain-containing protein [Nanoarchaeota archaeon]
MTNFGIAVKAFIVNHNEEVLIIKRSPDDIHKPDVWDIPGGRLNTIDEDPFEGVKRETLEEVGLEIEIINPLQIKHFTRDDGQKITMIIFLCKPLTFDVKLSKEHTEYRWIHIDKAKDILSHHFHSEIDAYKERVSPFR